MVLAFYPGLACLQIPSSCQNPHWLRWNTMATNDAHFFLQSTRKWRAARAGEACQARLVYQSLSFSALLPFIFWNLWCFVGSWAEQCSKPLLVDDQMRLYYPTYWGFSWLSSSTMEIAVNQPEHAPPTGLDTEGHVYILCGDEPPDTKQITRMMTSKASLEESFPASFKNEVWNNQKGSRCLPLSGVLW